MHIHIIYVYIYMCSSYLKFPNNKCERKKKKKK